MDTADFSAHRRLFLAGLAATAASLPFANAAQAGMLGLTDLLGNASDNALDRLAQPGAFYDDPDVRIGLPFIGGGKSSLLGSVTKLGLFDGLVRKLNDAAGTAAGVAKPIFRDAISGLSLSDMPGIVGKNDGATQYLKESSSDTLHTRFRPHVDDALGNIGAYKQFDKLSKKNSMLSMAGLSHDSLAKSVTDQALKGIFSYMGNEEAKLRSDPLGKAGGLLKGLIGK